MTSFMYPGQNLPDLPPATPPAGNKQFADWGKVLIETDIDKEIMAILYIWMPTYLSQIEREREFEPGFLQRPKPAGYQNALEDDTFPAATLPAIVVTTAQTESDPDQRPDRDYHAIWKVVVSAALRGRSPAETRELASIFGGCVRRILIHQGIELAGWIKWVGSGINPQPDSTDDRGRYLAIAVNQFTVFTDEALTGDGPIVPTDIESPYPPGDPGDPDTPYDPLVKVTKVMTTINAR